MELIEGITTRRSIRKFTDEKIPRTLLEQIVSEAAYAPSWKNTQIARYIAIDDRSMLDYIADKFTDINASRVKSAPVLIALCFEKGHCGFESNGSYSTDRGEAWQMFDCGIAAQTFTLAAHSHNVGTVIMGLFDRAGLQEYLKLPENIELMALIACGRYNDTPQPPKRKSVSELLSFK